MRSEPVGSILQRPLLTSRFLEFLSWLPCMMDYKCKLNKPFSPQVIADHGITAIETLSMITLYGHCVFMHMTAGTVLTHAGWCQKSSAMASLPYFYKIVSLSDRGACILGQDSLFSHHPRSTLLHHPTTTEVTRSNITPWFSVSTGDLYSGPHACTESALPVESSFQTFKL